MLIIYPRMDHGTVLITSVKRTNIFLYEFSRSLRKLHHYYYCISFIYMYQYVYLVLLLHYSYYYISCSGDVLVFLFQKCIAIIHIRKNNVLQIYMVPYIIFILMMMECCTSFFILFFVSYEREVAPRLQVSGLPPRYRKMPLRPRKLNHLQYWRNHCLQRPVLRP